MAVAVLAIRLAKVGIKAYKDRQELQRAGNVDPFIDEGPAVAPSERGMGSSSRRDDEGEHAEPDSPLYREKPGLPARARETGESYSTYPPDMHELEHPQASMREASRPTFDKSEYLSEDYGPQALRPMMSKDTQYQEAPPSYDQATSSRGSGSRSSGAPAGFAGPSYASSTAYGPCPSQSQNLGRPRALKRADSSSSTSSSSSSEHGRTVPPGYTLSNGMPISWKAYRRIRKAERRVERERRKADRKLARDGSREMRKVEKREWRLEREVMRAQR